MNISITEAETNISASPGLNPSIGALAASCPVYAPAPNESSPFLPVASNASYPTYSCIERPNREELHPYNHVLPQGPPVPSNGVNLDPEPAMVGDSEWEAWTAQWLNESLLGRCFHRSILFLCDVGEN
ncbi:hypothetical protein M422DRAFT_31768 [Sphaerobolus stellatus SS14]|uniref:Uncharacterized protein n=1 Tax=Sphaerobolus stellatus (strain SS14) TaxID=990650 RepID=A0A0C9VIS9_SPHS4|nr:hypothetical protein M422DRAFT_31767 [Sphaerobolus stellatus SS14]KIJ41412.1 hypothetical protein M422DRAFT_31768 [Sphaerobolus stellatus SS14]